MKALLPILAFTALPLAAQSISSDDAREVARQFFAARTTIGAQHAPAKVDPVLAYTATTAGTADFYVFNRTADASTDSQQAQGFVIVNAADGAEMPILGYSETSTFDYATAPSNLRWWLEQYQKNGVARVPAKAGAARLDIAPLVTTTWGQDEPYNNRVPQPDPIYAAFVTGCTATAMAQIMNYHSYPATGRGSNSYTINYGAFTKTFSANFETARYDWSNMLNDYNGSYTAAQADAVATLMYHAGVAENSVYADQTSADDRHSGMALINNFRYSPAMLRGERAYFTDDEWDNTIYSELAAGRPVMYSGSTTKKEGHAFVCDGYRASDGFFHINWGWEGMSDSYFTLIGAKALDPDSQGTGGAASGQGFTESQSINYNILPTEAGEYPVQACVSDHFTVGTDPVVRQTFTSRTIDRSHDGDIPVYIRLASYNNGFATINIKSGVMLRHTATGLSYPQFGFEDELELEPGQSKEYFYTVSSTNSTPKEYAHFDTSTAPYNGTYEIVPAFTADNGATWHPMATLASDALPTITIVGGEDAEAVELSFTLSAKEVEVGKTVTITPLSDYTGTVTYTTSNPSVASVSSTGVVTGLSEGHVTITATSTATAAFLATTKEFDIEVVGHIMHDVDVSISKTILNIDETASISITPEYEGEVSYTVSPAGIVSVSDAGVVTALADGEATITVTIAGDADYKATTKHFDVTVTSAPPAPAKPGLCMNNYPYVGDNNIATSNNMTLHIPLYNSSSSSIRPVTFYVRMNCDGGSVKWTLGYEDSYAFPAGAHDDYTLNPFEEGCSSYFTPGNVYTYEFYLDSACTKPMNVPSLSYYYCPANPTTATLTKLIDNGKKGQGATVKLIKALANKVLEK